MYELAAELLAAPMHAWQYVPITVGHHTWWLRWYRYGDSGNYYFLFVSPSGRRYSFRAAHGKHGGRITDADVTLASGKTIASYWGCWGDSPERLAAVIRLTPRHILDRLSVLLDAVG